MLRGKSCPYKHALFPWNKKIVWVTHLHQCASLLWAIPLKSYLNERVLRTSTHWMTLFIESGRRDIKVTLCGPAAESGGWVTWADQILLGIHCDWVEWCPRAHKVQLQPKLLPCSLRSQWDKREQPQPTAVPGNHSDNKYHFLQVMILTLGTKLKNPRLMRSLSHVKMRHQICKHR